MTDAPIPNGGIFSPAVYRGGKLIPSESVRLVIRAADARAKRWELIGRWLGVIGVTL